MIAEEVTELNGREFEITILNETWSRVPHETLEAFCMHLGAPLPTGSSRQRGQGLGQAVAAWAC